MMVSSDVSTVGAELSNTSAVTVCIGFFFKSDLSSDRNSIDIPTDFFLFF